MPIRKGWRDEHKTARGFERRLGKALERAFLRMQERFEITTAAYAIGNGDMRTVERIGRDAEDSLAPIAGIVHDALDRGGRLAAEDIRAEFKRRLR